MRMFGFTHHTGKLPPSSEELAAAWRPYIETCIAAFWSAARDVREQFLPLADQTVDRVLMSLVIHQIARRPSRRCIVCYVRVGACS
jgi:hypothetical protein